LLAREFFFNFFGGVFFFQLLQGLGRGIDALNPLGAGGGVNRELADVAKGVEDFSLEKARGFQGIEALVEKKTRLLPLEGIESKGLFIDRDRDFGGSFAVHHLAD
jgi:hypothetical protein